LNLISVGLNRRPEGSLELVRRPGGSTRPLSTRDRHPNQEANGQTDRGAQWATQRLQAPFRFPAGKDRLIFFQLHLLFCMAEVTWQKLSFFGQCMDAQHTHTLQAHFGTFDRSNYINDVNNKTKLTH
jgi:hypothetical protein